MNIRIARKGSICIRCGKSIPQGAKMTTVTTWDYGIAPAHPECRAAWIKAQMSSRGSLPPKAG